MASIANCKDYQRSEDPHSMRVLSCYFQEYHDENKVCGVYVRWMFVFPWSFPMAVSPRLGCLQSNAQNHTMQQPSKNIQKPSDVGGLTVYIAKVALYFLGSFGMSTGPVTIKTYQKYIYKLHKGTYPSRWGTILKSPILTCFFPSIAFFPI